MFFITSKLSGLVLQPVNFFALAFCLGLALALTRWARTGRRIVASVAVIFIICCFLPVGTGLLRVLEDQFPLPPADLPPPAGIIVLGGSIDEEHSRARGEISTNRAASRLTAGVALARRFPNAKLVFTGGSADMRQLTHGESEGVERLWRSLGVPEAQMSFERKSRNTFENAVFTKDMVTPKPGETWLLVTSAWHMPRSMGIFRRTGFPVTAYPVDFRTFGDPRDWKPSLIAVDALDRLDTAVHEWVGLIAYRLTGKTDALLPGP